MPPSSDHGPVRDRCRLQLLADAGAVIAEECDSGLLLQRLAETLIETVADVVIVYLVEDDRVRRRVRVHRDREKIGLLDRLKEIAPLRRGDPAVQRVLEKKETLLVAGSELETWIAGSNHTDAVRDLALRSVVFAPLIGRSGPLGVLAAASEDGGRPPLSDGDATVIGELGRRAGLVLENARFDEDHRRHDARMQAIAAASRAFAEAMPDFEGVLGRLTRVVADHVGDYCTVRLVSRDGEWMELTALHHPDEEARRTLRSLSRKTLPSARKGLFGGVVEAGEAVFLPSEDSGEMCEKVPSAVRPYHDERPVRGVILVPMRARGRTIGVLSAWREGPSRPYTPHDRILLQDLADQGALSVENARLYREAQAANRSKSNFLALISHELRTPVNAVLGHADLLDLDSDPPLSRTQEESVQRIKANCHHLTRVMQELITYARLDDHAEERSQPVVIRLAPRIWETVAEVEGDARRKGLSLTVDVPDDIQLSLDPQRYRITLLNLLTNAVRFTEEGEIRVQARRRGGGRVHIRVSDTGIGIDPAHRKDVFTPFWQVAEPHTRETGGTGLGLSLSRRLARLMGGDIEVESEPGVGSTFELTLPLTAARRDEGPPGS